MKCHKCKIEMEPVKGHFEEDYIDYDYYKCRKCGEELVDMAQLHKTADRYRALRKAKDVIFQKWGNSLAVRIPAAFAETLGIRQNGKGLLLLEKKAMKIVP